MIERCNPPDLVRAHEADIEKYASWLNKDMAPGLISASTYIPGKGLTLEYQGQLRGTIPGKEFAQMYYRYNAGQKAKKILEKGCRGCHKIVTLHARSQGRWQKRNPANKQQGPSRSV